MEGRQINENLVLYKDLGSFGEGKWQNHLTLVSWFGKEPKYDIRSWNEDMSKCGKGITLDNSELYDLMCLIEDALGDDGEQGIR